MQAQIIEVYFVTMTRLKKKNFLNYNFEGLGLEKDTQGLSWYLSLASQTLN